MKKIAILTAARTNNNGTDLQAYAMYTVFSRYPCDVEVVNYSCTKLENSHKLLLRPSLHGFLNIPYRLFLNISHGRFRKKAFCLKAPVRYPDDMRMDEYSVVVVGSDQIWNLDITGGDLNFFLPKRLGDFKRYSYAASLGKTDIGEWENTYGISGLLADFEGVSVRESTGVEAMAKIGVDARHDLDPILLLTKEELAKITKKGKRKKPYIFVYMVGENALAREFAEKYAKENGLELIVYVGAVAKPRKGVVQKTFVDLGQWLALMKNASMVVTNSYHGLSVAISLNVAVRVFGLKNVQSQTRMTSLLESVNLGRLFVESREDLAVDQPIDWRQVEASLNTLREASLKYIEEITLSERNDRGQNQSMDQKMPRDISAVAVYS